MYIFLFGLPIEKGEQKGKIYEDSHWTINKQNLAFSTQWQNKCLKAAPLIIWAPSSEFVSSSIPSWQILTAHAQPFRGARDLAFCLKVPLDSLLVWASSEGSGETARMRRLAWTFAARIGDKYQIHLTRSTCTLEAKVATWIDPVYTITYERPFLYQTFHVKKHSVFMTILSKYQLAFFV